MPGHLVEIPLQPFSGGIPHPLSGDDRTITSIAFDDRGIAFYTAGDHRGGGNFGILDFATFSTRRLISKIPAAHAIAFDPFTGDLFLFGADQIAQIDPRNPRRIKSSLDFDQESLFDQGSTDGEGHLVVARTSGHVVFIDYAASGLVGDASNFVTAAFVDSNLDDIAPLAGLGANPTTATSSAIQAGPPAQSAPGPPDEPEAAAGEESGEAMEEPTEPGAGEGPDSAISWALAAFALAILLVLTLAWGARMLLATWRRARHAARAPNPEPASPPPEERVSARQRDANLLQVARRGFAGLLDGTEPQGLVEALVRDAVAITGSAAGSVRTGGPARPGRPITDVQVGAGGDADDPAGATAASGIDLPLQRDGAVLGHLTLSRDSVEGDEIAEAALAPLAAVLTAILERAAAPQSGQGADDARLLGATAKMLGQNIEVLESLDRGEDSPHSSGRKATASPDDFRRQLDSLKEIESLLARLSSATFDDAGEESVDLGPIAEEVSSALRGRDPGRSTRITIAPGALAVGNPARLRAAVEGLLSAAWRVNRGGEPTNIEFGVTDRGGRAVCFARCRGAGPRTAEPGHSPAPSPAPSDGKGARPAPDIGLALVRYALGGRNTRIWTENGEGEGAAFFFALPGRDTSEQPRTGWRTPGS
ncbi:MAG: HAMP domain-containing histidine kinase [Proteobacteria bacterium]|nr:HAMP domain-containing histidine kinase [Pseudomonadota bacterium]